MFCLQHFDHPIKDRNGADPHEGVLLIWLRWPERHLADFDQNLPLCKCDGPKPTALLRVHGTPTEELSRADRAWYDDRCLRQSPTVLLLRTPSFPPPVIGLKSTQVIASNPAPVDGRRPFTGEFLANHYRDISFYDEYVFPVTCERTNGIPDGRDPGDFDVAAEAESSRRSQRSS